MHGSNHGRPNITGQTRGSRVAECPSRGGRGRNDGLFATGDHADARMPRMETWATFFAFVIGNVGVGFLAASTVPGRVMERRLVLKTVLDIQNARSRLLAMNTIRVRAKCSVPGCPNSREEWAFIGNVCVPCRMFLFGLTHEAYSQAARNAERRMKTRDLTMRAQELDRQLKGEEPS